MEYECTPREEIQSRILRFQKLLLDNNIDSAIISQNVDLFYFTGTIQPSYLFIPAGGEPVLAVQENLARVRRESSLDQIIPLKNGNQLSQTISGCNKSVQGRIGLEMDVLPVNRYLMLCRDFPQASFLDISDLIKKVRAVKSEYEISQIRKAVVILHRVMEEARRIIYPGMTELEVDAMLGALARKSGHQGRLRMRGYNQEMFYAHVFSGETGAVPSFLKGPLGGLGTTPAIAQGASFKVIKENQPIIIDFGVGINGYVTDMTRTFVIGRLSENLLQAYSFLTGIKHFMEQWVRPGKRCSMLYKEAIELAHNEGYQDYFMGYKDHQMPFVGHGIGLEINEYPLITANSTDVFRENMVFAFEPKLVFPDIGAVGVEDDYRVSGTGIERLTDYNDGILVIEHTI
jgi:Xaa-Pro dipeptidase